MVHHGYTHRQHTQKYWLPSSRNDLQRNTQMDSDMLTFWLQNYSTSWASFTPTFYNFFLSWVPEWNWRTKGWGHGTICRNYFMKIKLHQCWVYYKSNTWLIDRQRQSKEHLQCWSSALLRCLWNDMQLLHTFIEVNNPVDDCRASWDGVALPHLRNHACTTALTRRSFNNAVAN